MKFDINAFDFLNGEEFEPGWANLGQSDLDAITNTLLSGELAGEAGLVLSTVDAFFSTMDKLKPAVIGEYKPEDLLGVHADEMGLLDVVLGPAIFRDEYGMPVVKTGSNLFALGITGSSAKAGDLEGDIEVLEIGDEKILVVAMDCLVDGLDETLSISFVLAGDDDTRPTKAKVKRAIKEGTLAELLKPVPTGGGFVKMNDLQEKTEYLVTAIEERPTHEEYGRSWSITLEGVGNVVSKGKQFEKGLAQNAAIYKKLIAGGQSLTLLVSSIKEIPSGIQVRAGFFKRAPKPEYAFKSQMKSAELKSAEVQEVKAISPAIEVESVLVSDEQKELAEVSY